MFSVKFVIIFPSVLYSVSTCRLDGCDVFFSSYVQGLLCFSHVDGFTVFTVTLFLSSFGIGPLVLIIDF